MTYMDHWADNDPPPNKPAEYRVGFRANGGTIYVKVDAINCDDAEDKARAVLANARRFECLTKGQY